MRVFHVFKIVQMVPNRATHHICPVDQRIFIWPQNNQLTGIITYFINDIIWGGTQCFYKTVNKNSKPRSKLDQKVYKHSPTLV